MLSSGKREETRCDRMEGHRGDWVLRVSELLKTFGRYLERNEGHGFSLLSSPDFSRGEFQCQIYEDLSQPTDVERSLETGWLASISDV